MKAQYPRRANSRKFLIMVEPIGPVEPPSDGVKNWKRGKESLLASMDSIRELAMSRFTSQQHSEIQTESEPEPEPEPVSGQSPLQQSEESMSPIINDFWSSDICSSFTATVTIWDTLTDMPDAWRDDLFFQ
jgi:hypothetical protein